MTFTSSDKRVQIVQESLQFSELYIVERFFSHHHNSYFLVIAIQKQHHVDIFDLQAFPPVENDL